MKESVHIVYFELSGKRIAWKTTAKDKDEATQKLMAAIKIWKVEEEKAPSQQQPSSQQASEQLFDNLFKDFGEAFEKMFGGQGKYKK